jgi:glycosyltransferase involved in cell wall biosynthesis
MTALRANRPTLDSKLIVCIANGPGGWRTWYKGIDLLIQAFERVATKHRDARLAVAGEWAAPAIAELLAHLRAGRERVRFVGPQTDLLPLLQKAALYLHLGRGDAFPLSVLEALCAGVPAIVSEWTGTRQAVREVDQTLVVALDPSAAAARVDAYLTASSETRSRLGDAARRVGCTYTETQAIKAFQAAVASLHNRSESTDQ